MKCLPKGYSRGGANRSVVRSLVRDNNVTYVLDAFHCPIFLRWACRGLGVKIIRYHHNKPDTNGRIEAARNLVMQNLWRFATRWMVRLDYWLDDAYVILSNSFQLSFIRFTGIKRPRKLFAINNPLTIEPCQAVRKENIILYCGRLDEHQKRVSRIFDIWRKIMNNLPDWRLEIVGDGPERERYEKRSKDLVRVSFTGFKSPGPHYAKAKILMLTSDFEGWPLVLAESMSCGCVPVALGSFEAVHDLITDGKDGIVIPVPFDACRFADVVRGLATNAEKLSLMATNSELSSSRFSIGNTVDKWEEVLEFVNKE